MSFADDAAMHIKRKIPIRGWPRLWLPLIGVALIAASHGFAIAGESDTDRPLRVEPTEVFLSDVGWTQQLLVTGADPSGREIDRTTTGCRFESSNTAVATISSSGLVRAVGQGRTTVRLIVDGGSKEVPVTVDDENRAQIRFGNDVVPILTKTGCNAGGCHGKSTGQNGFKMSLLGFETALDYGALVQESRGRRISIAAPDNSLLLLKATATVPHGGGKRFDVDSDDYRVLRQWIADGARPPTDDDPTLERIVIRPEQRVLDTNAQQQLLVTAHFSDGHTRDVTRQAVYLSNEPDLAEVEPDGLVNTKSQSGLFAVMARFGDQIAVFHGTVPFARVADDSYRPDADISGIDKYLVEQWQQLGIRPSDEVDDAAFIRRATLDICGTLPTASEVTEYEQDQRAYKRSRLIDRLLDRPEYASYFALKWADILQNRGKGYSTSKQRSGTTLFANWIRESIANNKPYDVFVSEIITATGSQRENPPTVWYRTVRTTTEYVESVAQAFLGVRVQCAQCHHHPFERWSQADYYGLAAVFARVGRKGGFADAEVPTEEEIFVKDTAHTVNPRTGQVMKPRPLGGPDFELNRFDDPRRGLARWMADPENPYLAQTMVNRMWGHFFARGIIHPIDDARSTNPPTNPELLQALTRDFIASGYDVKHLVRVICNSYAYRLSSSPNETNAEDTQSFARYYPRRLPAEVLLDAISQVLEVPTKFPGGPGEFPLGTRAVELPDENVDVNFLDVFGRPDRSSACECERVDLPTLGQALELVNSAEIQRKLTDENSFAARLATSGEPPAENVKEVFLTTLARLPRPDEQQAAIEFLQEEADPAMAYQSLLWSMMGTNEFMFNH